MKRILCLFLCLLLVVGVFGCSKKEEASTLQVGFGREDITPAYSMPMRGYANPMERWSQTVLDPLYTTCIAFRDADGNTALLYHNDLCSTPATVFTFIRKEISEQTGIPVDNIMVSASTDTEAPEARKWGMIINTEAVESTVNLYGGTLDASNCTAQYGCAINQTAGTFNMYGGEILGGTAYGTGSTAIRVGGNFNMYGGRIVGGKHIDIGYQSINVEGGATIRASGIITIYDGIIEGGESYTNGGSIYLADNAKLVMKGGTITGGKSAANGGGVYATNLATITVSGNARITGNEKSNLWIDSFAKIYIGDEGLGEEALIGISMTQPGEFLSGVPEGADITKHFVSDTPSQKLVKSGADGWALK